MPRNIIHQRRLQVCAALLAADCLVFTLVDPLHASAIWLIVGYVLLGLTLYCLANLLASSLRAYGELPHKLGKRLLHYSAIMAAAMIGLQSIGQLTTKDVVTLLPFVVLAYLYVSYGRKFARAAT